MIAQMSTESFDISLPVLPQWLKLKRDSFSDVSRIRTDGNIHPTVPKWFWKGTWLQCEDHGHTVELLSPTIASLVKRERGFWPEEKRLLEWNRLKSNTDIDGRVE